MRAGVESNKIILECQASNEQVNNEDTSEFFRLAQDSHRTVFQSNMTLPRR
jgi:hypothetical protein